MDTHDVVNDAFMRWVFGNSAIREVNLSFVVSKLQLCGKFVNC